MTNANKVKVSKEVAEAIVNALVYHKPDEIVATSVRNGWEERGNKNYGCLNKRNLDLDTLIKAVYFGFKIGETPIEKVIRRYRFHKEAAAFHETIKRRPLDLCEIEQERYSSGFVAGAEEIAKAYGLKIEGVDVK